jgi:hypothetical protein
MNISLFRRADGTTPEPGVPPLPVARDPRTLEFMDHHHSLEQKVNAQAIELCEGAIQRETLECRIRVLEDELAIVRYERDRYLQGFLGLNAQMDAVAMMAISSIKAVANAAIHAKTAAKEELENAGLTVKTPMKEEPKEPVENTP